MTIFTLKKEFVAFGGTLVWLGDKLPPSFHMDASLWRLGYHLLAHDAIERGRV